MYEKVGGVIRQIEQPSPERKDLGILYKMYKVYSCKLQ